MKKKERVLLLTDETFSFEKAARFGVTIWDFPFQVSYRPDRLADKLPFEETYNYLTVNANRVIPNPLSEKDCIINIYPRGEELEKFDCLNDYIKSLLFDLAEQNKSRWSREDLKKRQQELF